MGTEEDRRAKLENDAATKQLRLAMETDEERKARLEKMVASTQLRLALVLARLVAYCCNSRSDIRDTQPNYFTPAAQHVLGNN